MQEVSRRALGSTTTQDCPGTRAIAPGHVAFRTQLGRRRPNWGGFRSSIPSPPIPLFTLRGVPHGTSCKTRGRADRYSFLVGLFHPLLPAGLSRRTTVPTSLVLAHLVSFLFPTIFAGCLPRPSSVAGCPVTQLSLRVCYYTAVRLLAERRSPFRFRL